MELKINIDGLSQLEIEELFSRDSIDEAIAVELAPLLDELSQSFFDNMDELLGYNSESFIYDLIIMLGNPHMTQVVQDKRTIEISSLFKHMIKILDNDITKAKKVMELCKGNIFEVETFTQFNTFDTSFHSYKLIVIGYGVSDDVLALQKYKMYQLPMFEQPKNWIVGQSGGYHRNESKCTLNRGSAKQPQNVLDVLNTLQNNAWKLHKDTNLDDRRASIVKSLMEKKGYSIGTATRISLETTLSAQSTYEAIGNKEYYFQWKFDARGRAYPSGYNVNPQGDSYTKAMNIPVHN